MIGESFATKYFGTYVEKKDVDKPAEELVGKVIVRQPTMINSKAHAYLYVNKDRYDLPDFMKEYDGKAVAVLCRKTTKVSKSGRKYNKLIVITAKEIAAADLL
ncbi:MAG: hypothetical protein NC218_02090 [Acetobacter sp.]|nr:hypothetical protein [Acetobacter sp.]